MPHEITTDVKDEWLKCKREAIETLDLDQGHKERLYLVVPQLVQHMVNN